MKPPSSAGNVGRRKLRTTAAPPKPFPARRKGPDAAEARLRIGGAQQIRSGPMKPAASGVSGYGRCAEGFLARRFSAESARKCGCKIQLFVAFVAT